MVSEYEIYNPDLIQSNKNDPHENISALFCRYFCQGSSHSWIYSNFDFEHSFFRVYSFVAKHRFGHYIFFPSWTKWKILIFQKIRKKILFHIKNIFHFFSLFFRLTVRVGRRGAKNPGSIPVASFESELYTIYHDIWKRRPHRLVFADFRENRWKWRDDVDMEAGFNLFILCQIVEKPSSSVSTYHHPTNLSTSYISYLASNCTFWSKLIIFRLQCG